MALDLGTILAVVELVERAVTVYRRIEGAPDQMRQLGEQMETLSLILKLFEGFFREQNTAATKLFFAPGTPDPREVTQEPLKRIKIKAEEIKDLFERYEKGILSRSMDLEFRNRWVSKLWFSLVDNSPAKIQGLIDEIERDRNNLRDCLQFMLKARDTQTPASARPPAQPKKPVQKKQNQKPPAAKKPSAPTTTQGVKKAPTSKTTTTAPVKPPKAIPLPTTNSLITPPRTDHKILFVDLYNTDRSIIAEALLKLLGHLTTTTAPKEPWPISTISSAGFFVRAGASPITISAIDSLHYLRQSYKRGWHAGGDPPTPVGMAAVFDNQWLANHPFKDAVKEELSGRRSLGLPSGEEGHVFREWDLIVVFTKREEENLGC
ncbi:hypothetical protein N0V88_004953 [Collariella sp. IMI 366227]|nr:hypothetical protein N0V88_004953 [Collariella sp. IMI 366227]